MRNRIIYFILLVITASVTFPSAAKDKPSPEERRQWMEKMENYRKEYIVKALQLTDAQKTKFLPMYESMNRELRAVDDAARKTERSVAKKGASATDADYQKASEALFNIHSHMGAIETKYYKQFKTVLSNQQLFELKRAEDRFAREMMKHHREKKDKRK